MLVELLRPASPELGRRWLSVLLLVPEGERQAVVESVEARIVEAYAAATPGAVVEPAAGDDGAGEGSRDLVVVYPATQRDGFAEQIERVYAVRPGPGPAGPSVGNAPGRGGVRRAKRGA